MKPSLIADEYSPPALSRAPQARRSHLLLTAMVGAVLIPAVKKYLAAGLFAVRFFELYVPIFFLFFPLDFYLQVCHYYPEKESALEAT